MASTDALKALLSAAADALTGSARRVCLARTAAAFGSGGQRRAERELGWDRGTIRTGARELARGFAIVDASALRGRTPAEARLPRLLDDIAAIVDGRSQAGPAFRTARLCTRPTAAGVRRWAIAQRGYTDAQVPTRQTVGAARNALGYHPAKVVKTRPQESSPRPTPSSRD